MFLSVYSSLLCKYLTIIALKHFLFQLNYHFIQSSRYKTYCPQIRFYSSFSCFSLTSYFIYYHRMNYKVLSGLLPLSTYRLMCIVSTFTVAFFASLRFASTISLYDVISRNEDLLRRVRSSQKKHPKTLVHLSAGFKMDSSVRFSTLFRNE